MRFFSKAPDGGEKSGVTGYFLLEIKSIFSIVLLHFKVQDNRERAHNHAFNAITIWLKGQVIEENLNGDWKVYKAGDIKFTPRSMFHRIVPKGSAWAISFRGPWQNYWYEWRKGQGMVKLTHGRKEI
jgi:hypothetical protein